MIKLLIAGMMMFLSMNDNAMNEVEVNESNGYEYEITEINNNEVYGIALNNISEDNNGIVLYESDMDISVNVGDVISVEFGEYGDEIISVDIVEWLELIRYDMLQLNRINNTG